MKIEVGKFYKTRAGRTVGPMRLESITDASKHWGSDDNLGDYVASWFEDGSYWPEDSQHHCDVTAALDLISPAHPEQGTMTEILDALTA